MITIKQEKMIMMMHVGLMMMMRMLAVFLNRRQGVRSVATTVDKNAAMRIDDHCSQQLLMNFFVAHFFVPQKRGLE